MFQRLGNKDLPHSIRKQLQDVKQNVEESIEELTGRVQEMATDGYSEATEDIVELMAVEAFLKGCNDKKAGLAAMDKIHPESIKRYDTSRAPYIIRKYYLGMISHTYGKHNMLILTNRQTATQEPPQ